MLDFLLHEIIRREHEHRIQKSIDAQRKANRLAQENMNMHIPQGYTQEEIMEAASQLPCAENYARDRGDPIVCVAVRECCSAYFRPGCYPPASTVCRMRVLKFKLNNVLDFRTDRLIHFWTLSGEG